MGYWPLVGRKKNLFSQTCAWLLVGMAWGVGQVALFRGWDDHHLFRPFLTGRGKMRLRRAILEVLSNPSLRLDLGASRCRCAGVQVCRLGRNGGGGPYRRGLCGAFSTLCTSGLIYVQLQWN